MTGIEKTKKRKRIQYADHLRLRLAPRRIPEQLPRRIYRRAKERFFDTATHHHVAVARARYAGKIREMAVPFEENEATYPHYHPPLESGAEDESDQFSQVDNV